MKKVLIVLVMALTVMSCSKEESEDCNCGLIVSDDVTDYSVTIRSDCSGNERRFTLTEGDWFNAHPGDDYCITNSTGW